MKLQKVKYRKIRQMGVVMLSAALIFTATACSGRQKEEHTTQGTTSVSAGQTTGQKETPAVKPTDASVAEPTETVAVTQKEVTLYIGTRDEGFVEYPVTCEGDVTPEVLIAEIGELTGWDMSLSEAVTTGKGGMSVCFAENSALFAGPPEPQREEFFMFSAEQLAHTLLDSVQKTLQMGFTGEGGDPDALDIYYYMPGEVPLALPDIDKEWPLDKPYQW